MPPAEVVDEASGGRNHDIDTPLQGFRLRPVGDASVHRSRVYCRMLAIRPGPFQHLLCELTGGDQNEGARRSRLPIP